MKSVKSKNKSAVIVDLAKCVKSIEFTVNCMALQDGVTPLEYSFTAIKNSSPEFVYFRYNRKDGRTIFDESYDIHALVERATGYAITSDSYHHLNEVQRQIECMLGIKKDPNIW